MTAELVPSVEILRHAGVPQGQVDAPLGRLVVLLASRYGLDPALRHVEVIPAGKALTVYITADGWRFIAERSGELDGLTFENVERGEHGWRATALAWKKGCSHPFEGRAGCGFSEKAADPEAIAMTRATRRALRNGFASKVSVPSELALIYSDAEPHLDDDGFDVGTVPAAAAVPASAQVPAPDRHMGVARSGGWDPDGTDQAEARTALTNMNVKARLSFLKRHRIDKFDDPWPAEAIAEALAAPAGFRDTAPAGAAGNEEP